MLNKQAHRQTELKHHEQAIELLEKATLVRPDKALYWINKGTCYQPLGRYDEAVQCFDRALALDPANAHALAYKAESLGLSGRLPQSCACFEQLLKLGYPNVARRIAHFDSLIPAKTRNGDP